MFALGNEIPPGVVRWHGSLRVERFLRDLYQDAKSDLARVAVHVRQLSADRVPRPLVLRRVRVQRLPAPRARAARVSDAAAAHRRLQAAAAGRSGRRFDSGRRRRTGRDHGDAHPRRLRRRRLRRGRVLVDRRMVARRPRRGRLGVRPRRPRAAHEAGGRRRRAGVQRRAVFGRGPGRHGRACPWSSARTTRPTRSRTVSRRSTGSRIPTTRSSSSTTAPAMPRATSDGGTRACGSSTSRTPG